MNAEELRKLSDKSLLELEAQALRMSEAALKSGAASADEASEQLSKLTAEKRRRGL